MPKLAWCSTLALLLFAACRPSPTAPVGPPAPADPPPEPAPVDVLEASNLPAPLPSPLPDDPLETTIHRLSNGMTVYISPLRDEPRIRAHVVVRAGGRHDPAHATGLAHYLEHMVLFKGSDELGTVDHEAERPHLDAIRALYRELSGASSPAEREAVFAKIDAHTQAVARHAIPNEPIRLYERMGFSGTNAFTNQDITQYVTELPRNRVEPWANLESERLADPVFRLFYPELEAVYEEKNRSLDSPMRQLAEQMQARSFPAHPYGTQTVLGNVEHLKTPAFDEMAAFFRRWYVPNNMAIVLVGDVDASILPLLERTFGRLSPAALEAPPPGELTGPRGRVEATVVAPGAQRVRVSWRTVAIDHPDRPIVELIDRLLDDDLIGVLNELELSGQVPSVRSLHIVRKEGGTLSVDATIRDDMDHAQVEALLLEAVGRLKAGTITAQTLAAAKLQHRIANTRADESINSRAWRIARAFAQGRRWADVVAEASRIEAVTLSDIQRVANRYLGEDFVVGRVVRGQPSLAKIPKPKITPLQFSEASASPMAERLEAMPAPPIEPVFVEAGRDFSETPMPWGRLLAAPNTRNDLFDLAVVVPRGSREDPLLCHALRVFERSGTEDLSAAELQRAFYEQGSSVEVRCDDDETVVLLRGVDANFEPAVDLLSRWLRAPKLEESRREATVATALTRRRAALDDDRALTSALRNRAYFGRRSPQLNVASNAELRAAGVKRLRALVTGLTEYRHTIAYYGPRRPVALRERLALGSGRRAPGSPYVRRYRRRSGPEVHVVHRDSAKANVSLVFPGEAISRERLGLVQSTQAYLRQRSFDEIRGARALAYVVRAGIDVGLDPRDEAALWGFVQSQPDKVVTTLRAFSALLRSPSFDGTTFDNAVSSRRENIRSTQRDPHDVPYQVARWARFGVDRDPSAIVWDGLDAANIEDAAAMAASLTASPAIITVVGDTSRIDLDALADLGRVTLHEPSRLFSYGSFD